MAKFIFVFFSIFLFMAYFNTISYSARMGGGRSFVTEQNINAQAQIPSNPTLPEPKLTSALNQDNNTDDISVKGPKIFGLQIGMPAADAKPIIEEICKKDNINCNVERVIDPMMFFGEGAKGIEAWGSAGYRVAMYFKNNILVGYKLPFTIFNYKAGIDTNIFLQQLADHYNLSLKCTSNYECTDQNSELGYKVLVNPMAMCISVFTIPKTDSLQFK